MQYYSTTNRELKVSLQEAVLKGLAPDNGLFMPLTIPTFPEAWMEELSNLSFREIGYRVIGALFASDLTNAQIQELVDHTLTFDAPLVPIEQNVFSLELFHGPTLAFKDFGARFCAKLLGMLVETSAKKTRILVATSGDTGGAVANGFLNVAGVEVIILYPKGKVSLLQEKQFTSLGKNIICLEVEGVFDDCQSLVKQAFIDPELNEKLILTSANSINVARWVPQCLYYFYAYSRLPKKTGKIVFSVPSGNLGNLAAGVLAQRMGLPITQFIAATNENKVVPTFLMGSYFEAKPSIPTLSNAMDVGNPSNFSRLLNLFEGDEEKFRNQVKGYFFSDAQTVEAMQSVYRRGYTLDPHGAIGYLGLKQFLEIENDCQGIFLETAHPGKFQDVVEKAIRKKIKLPERLAIFQKGEKKTIPLTASFNSFKQFLLGLD